MRHRWSLCVVLGRSLSGKWFRGSGYALALYTTLSYRYIQRRRLVDEPTDCALDNRQRTTDTSPLLQTFPGNNDGRENPSANFLFSAIVGKSVKKESSSAPLVRKLLGLSLKKVMIQHFTASQWFFIFLFLSRSPTQWPTWDELLLQVALFFMRSLIFRIFFLFEVQGHYVCCLVR